MFLLGLIVSAVLVIGGLFLGAFVESKTGWPFPK